jgi:hypothetical protein
MLARATGRVGSGQAVWTAWCSAGRPAKIGHTHLEGTACQGEGLDLGAARQMLGCLTSVLKLSHVHREGNHASHREYMEVDI